MAQNMHREVFHALGLLCLFLLMIPKGIAHEFKVGGAGNWAVPGDANANSYNDWAQRSRFQTGDTLLFVYAADKDSVLYVSKEDYNNCNTDAPIEKYTDGHTVFKISHSGPYYFISGVKDNCLKNEKLIVIVMADRGNRSSAPTPAPSAEVPPSPAPAGEEPPSPPPIGSVEINPTPAPSQETPAPPPNGASSIVMSFIGSIGAFIGSSLLLVF